MLKTYQQNWLDKLDVIIEQNLDNASFCQRDLAISMFMSVKNLYVKTKRITTYSPNHYIRQKRLERAKELLLSSSNEYNLDEIAKCVGYSSKVYFIKLFMEAYQAHPEEFLQTAA